MAYARRLLLVALFAMGDCRAGPCAATIAELKALVDDERFGLEWRETSMDDAKPLVLSILEREGALFLVFAKTGEGLWAEGAGIVCRNESLLEARFAGGRAKVGPAASWAVRYGFENGAYLTLARVAHGTLRIETMGWSGLFAAASASRNDP